jgi:hypothetical protein
MIDKRLDPLKDLSYQPFTDTDTPCPAYQSLISSRSRNADAAKLITTRGIDLLQSQPLPGCCMGNFSSCFQISQTLHDRTHEGALLYRLFKIGHGLDHGNTAATAGKKYWPMRIRYMFHHTTGIGFQISKRNDIL